MVIIVILVESAQDTPRRRRRETAGTTKGMRVHQGILCGPLFSALQGGFEVARESLVSYK